MDLVRTTQNLATRAALAVHSHPRRLTAAASAVLLGSAVAAFGLAPMTATEETPISTRIVTEAIALADLGPQLSVLESRSLNLSSQTQTRGNDTVDSLLARLDVSDASAAAFLRKDAQARRILQGRSGKSVKADYEIGAGGITRLSTLTVRGPAASTEQAETHFTRITISRGAAPKPGAEAWQISTEQLRLASQAAMANGYIRTNLFAAADEARVPEAVVLQMADIFGSDIDFRRELRRGDQFAIVYETPTADGEPVSWAGGAGRVLAARFVNQGRTHDAMWYQDGNERGGYFAPDGQNKARSFLASPLAFSRISSTFSMRMHPILHTWRAHLGVDYAAGSGTPVRSVSDGLVEFAGIQSGYGNVVVVRHGATRSTLYGHLSRIAVKQGQHIGQGQTLGLVGSTGWATGPHLHFEFKLDGKQMDPIKMARNSEAQTLSASSRPGFELQLRESRAQLAAGALPPIDTAQLARME
jgi:murein DD-endopeptidase MepM/ murein hydrolase activator NlpD